MTPKRFGTYVLTVTFAGVVATACGTSSKSAPENEVEVAFDALSSAIAACGDGLATCAPAAGGDAAALQTCRDTFAQCRETAGAPAAAALGDAVAACTEQTGTCASTAAGQEASACHAELQTCLGANLSAPPPLPDAALGAGDAAPVAPCIDELLACISGSGDPLTCAASVRACIIAHVPAPPGVIPADPGSAAGDAGMPDDLPEPPADAGAHETPEPPTPDAGMAGDAPGVDCDVFDACVAAGGTQKTCGMQLRDCAR